jgi:hypothetical protein
MEEKEMHKKSIEKGIRKRPLGRTKRRLDNNKNGFSVNRG